MINNLSLLLITVIVLTIVPGCQNKAKDQIRKEAITNYLDAYNSFDIDRMTKDMDNNIKFEHLTDGQLNTKTTGIMQFKLLAEETKLYFDERNQSVNSWEFVEDKVNIDVNYFGVLRIDMSDRMQAGDTITMSGKSEFLFKDNKIIQIIDKS